LLVLLLLSVFFPHLSLSSYLLFSQMSLIYQPAVPRQQRKPNSSPDQQQRQRPGLYVGGKSDAKDYSKLLQRNITHILNMTPAKETGYGAGVPNYFERTSSTLHYKRIPIYDSPLSVTDLKDHVEDICDFIANALECHRSSILVHCQQGVSRSVTAALLYLIL
jgi:protein-tyrosine phosphatase